ncbi:MAG: MurR/RpiR family transcriptional regulator [Nocardioidaceae bacterium]
MDTLSPAERRVARALLSDYPSAGLSTATELARLASTSAPSVVRFTTRLGLGGFSDLQERLRNELKVRQDSPASRAEVELEGEGPSEMTNRGSVHRADLLVESIRSVPTSQIEEAVRSLADLSRAVLLSGGYFSTLIARYFSLQLSQVRPKVFYLAEPMHRDVNYLLGARRRDLFVTFDLRRYESETLIATQEAGRRGCTTLVITDQWLSPACAQADIVLPTETRASSFDSMVPALALVESLISPVINAIGPAAVEQMSEWEAINSPHRRHLADDEPS